MPINDVRLSCDCYRRELPQIIYLITGDLPIIVIVCPKCRGSLAIQPDHVLKGPVRDA
jgi:hypothetical protein